MSILWVCTLGLCNIASVRGFDTCPPALNIQLAAVGVGIRGSEIGMPGGVMTLKGWYAVSVESNRRSFDSTH